MSTFGFFPSKRQCDSEHFEVTRRFMGVESWLPPHLFPKSRVAGICNYTPFLFFWFFVFFFNIPFSSF